MSVKRTVNNVGINVRIGRIDEDWKLTDAKRLLQHAMDTAVYVLEEELRNKGKRVNEVQDAIKIAFTEAQRCRANHKKRLEIAKQLCKAVGLEYYCDKRKDGYSLKPAIHFKGTVPVLRQGERLRLPDATNAIKALVKLADSYAKLPSTAPGLPRTLKKGKFVPAWSVYRFHFKEKKS